MRLALLVGCAYCLLLAAAAAPVRAQEGDAVTVGSTAELFELLRKEEDPETTGDTISDILSAHLSGAAEGDEGSYPPSDLWETQFEARRELPEQLSYSGRGVVKYSEDDVSGIRKWEKELELNSQYEDWSGYIRLTDYNTFSYATDPFRLKKWRLRYAADDWRVTAGSVGGVFGRGLALNMFEERFLEFDNETQGVRIDGTLGKADVTLITGSRKNYNEVRHSAVTGLRWHAPVSSKVDIGAHYVNVEFPATTGGVVPPPTSSVSDAPDLNKDRLQMLGGDVTVRSGNFTGYMEYVQAARPVQPWGNEDYQLEGADGKGLYLNASYSGKGYALIGEYKDYRRIQHPFSVPPAVRRWQEKAQSYPSDDKGYNFQLLLTPGPAAGSWQFTYGQDNKREGGRPYSEFLVGYTSPTSKGGFSYVGEFFTVFDEIDTIETSKLTLNQELNEDWTSSALVQRKRHNPTFTDSYTYHLWSAEVAYRSVLGLVFTDEVSNQADAMQSKWQLWELKYKPDANQELGIVFGKRREGYVCSGGICRLEPAFEGTKVEYAFRF